jgi:archaeosine-15-forming tRNA-guanine transglycosylase
MKRVTILLCVCLILFLLGACGEKPTPSPVISRYEIASRYETLFNQGETKKLLEMFDGRSYISVLNRYDSSTGKIEYGAWNIYINVQEWLEARFQENINIKLSECVEDGNEITCRLVLKVDNHVVEGEQELVVINNLISVVRVRNDVLNP